MCIYHSFNVGELTNSLDKSRDVQQARVDAVRILDPFASTYLQQALTCSTCTYLPRSSFESSPGELCRTLVDL